jgi:hypothetical protein
VTLMIASLGPRFRCQARAFGAPPCGIGLDRLARPSKSGDRAGNALTAMFR